MSFEACIRPLRGRSYSEFEEFIPGVVDSHETLSGVGKVVCEQELLNEDFPSLEAPGIRGQPSRYDSPRTTLAVLEEDPKPNPQDLFKLTSCPCFGEPRKRAIPRRQNNDSWSCSVGQAPCWQAVAPDHGLT
uniref:Uncharacterized protein n=1 Tax=Solanum tuberosum TaxID=4113 RepID=M1D9F6_SOLTU